MNKRSNAVPSQIQSLPLMQRVFRLAVPGNAGSQLNTVLWTLGDLFKLWCVFAATASGTTSTTGFSVFQAVRIKRVVVWGTGASSNGTDVNTDTTVSLQWMGNVQGVARLVTSVGTSAIPAHISTVPPSGSGVSQWYALQSGVDLTQPMFQILNLDPGDFLDIHLEFVPAGVSTVSTNSTLPHAPDASTRGRIVYGSALAVGNYTFGPASTTSVIPVGLATADPSQATISIV